MRSPGNDLEAVLFDRDGTLVVDLPYNGDPALVTLMPGAREAVDAVRAAGLRVGMVTNQSGIARGLITRAQADAVNARVQELLGAFDLVLLCPHGSDDGCDCRKPRPGPAWCSRPAGRGAWIRRASRSSATSRPTWAPPGPWARAACSCPRP
ncbi:HAD-IIIA family hydrolase [Clavibacter michiganensis]|uniref:HAD-IIIA family hydrolase n=1 Tax=Clavibacter michiganensis TaxID=28447 RepID=UPI0029319C55|nr:HAD-IIIA family hydrolase [Clavibacter michiganensis]